MDSIGIRDCVAAGRYEEALQVGYEATSAEIQRSHMRALVQHRRSFEIRELINVAKTRLASETQLEKGRRFIRIGQKERALPLMEDALANGGDADDFLMTGQILEQLWRIESALVYFEKAVALRGSALDRLWLGMALERLERLEDAHTQYDKAVEIRGHAEDFLARGQLNRKMGSLERALADLEEAYKRGEHITSGLVIQEIQAEKSRAKFKKVVTAISGFLSTKNSKA